jgi:sugar lactone lactonase YvrE
MISWLNQMEASTSLTPPTALNLSRRNWASTVSIDMAPDGTLTLLVKDFVRPNGIAFSPDEKKLYVNDSEKGHIRVFDVKLDGTLENGRIFAELKDPSKSGVPDGMKVDQQGNVYSTGAGGVWVFSPSGNLLGKIEVPEVSTNLAWGDKMRLQNALHYGRQ